MRPHAPVLVRIRDHWEIYPRLGQTDLKLVPTLGYLRLQISHEQKQIE